MRPSETSVLRCHQAGWFPRASGAPQASEEVLAEQTHSMTMTRLSHREALTPVLLLGSDLYLSCWALAQVQHY